jgi:hypothetical protein
LKGILERRRRCRKARLGPGEETKAHLSSVETAMFEMDAMGGQYIRLAAVAPESAVGLRVFDASGQRVAERYWNAFFWFTSAA